MSTFYPRLLDSASPEQIPSILRRAADKYHESAAKRRSAWQDRYAGAIWDRYARILERAAMQCERELVACGLSADKGR